METVNKENIKRKWKSNPIINSDFPDPDIIRVDDTYYMASTTMHFMPGCDILRSYDLVNWELLPQVYEELEHTPRYCMEGNLNLYGQGMWAPTLRYHEGYFYLLFTSNDTQKTHLFCAENPCGPWERIKIEGFYYDSSLFFDDDGCVYIVHGQKTLRLTQLKPDLSGPLPGGLERIIAVDEEKINLGFEGSHMYKRNGKYYVFTCHMLAYGSMLKTEVCFVADSLTGEFKGKCVIDDDMGYRHLGVAQGGMVDTPDGEWYAFMFQDRGALGRAPVLMPMHFENDFPVLGENGKVPHLVCGAKSTKPGYRYEPLNGSDDFYYAPDKGKKVQLKRFWQFNHVPDPALWSVTEKPGTLRIKTKKTVATLMQAQNTLTQRMTGPCCAAEITLDAAELKDGDYAGLSAFMGHYGMVALTKDNGKCYVVMCAKPAKNETVFGDFEYEKKPIEYERILLDTDKITFRVEADFSKDDHTDYYWKNNGEWKKIGISQKHYFKMDHFTGCRFGIFMFSTKDPGGCAEFLNFQYISGSTKSAASKE